MKHRELQILRHFLNQRTVILHMRNKSRHGDIQEVIVLKQGLHFVRGCGWSCPLRLIKNGHDIKDPLSFNLFAAVMLRSNRVL